MKTTTKTTTKTTINRLALNFVEIDSAQYVEINGEEVKLDTPKHSVSYVNSIQSREQLQKEQSENIVAAVLAIWGDDPTVKDPQIPETSE